MAQEHIKHTDPEKRYRRVLAASTLAGDLVRNHENDDIGRIEEIMIDLVNGRVAYAVMAFGGVLGMGNKLFAVPWSALKVDEDRRCFILNVSRAQLDNAPGFSKDHWPDLADPDWQQQINRHYGTESYWDDPKVSTPNAGGGANQ